MLLDKASATQSFSEIDTAEESFSPISPGTVRQPAPAARHAAMVPGDRVVFARLDVAEALGIWRHATGRVVDTHEESPSEANGQLTVDVQFEGHETLQRYLPDLFEKRPN